MQGYITVTLVTVTEVRNDLGDTTETTASTDYDRVRFAPRGSNEGVDTRTPKVITAATLYRHGDFPLGSADRIIIADQHPLIDGTWQVEGDAGWWGRGVEVAITRAGD